MPHSENYEVSRPGTNPSYASVILIRDTGYGVRSIEYSVQSTECTHALRTHKSRAKHTHTTCTASSIATHPHAARRIQQLALNLNRPGSPVHPVPADIHFGYHP